ASGYEIAAWIAVAAAVLFALYHHLLSAVLSGLLVYAMVHRIAVQLKQRKLAHGKTQLVAVLILSGLLIVVSTIIVFALIAILRGHVGDIPELMQRIAKDLVQFRGWFISQTWIPKPEENYEKLMKWIYTQADDWKPGGEKSTHALVSTGHIVFHSLIGI